MLEKEFEYFKKNQDSLVKKYPFKFLVISDDRVIDAFDQFYDAYAFGVENLKLGNFMIQQAVSGESAYAASISTIGIIA